MSKNGSSRETRCAGRVFERGSFADDDNIEGGNIELVERAYSTTDIFNYSRGLESITQQYVNSRSRLRMSNGDTFSCTNNWVKISGTLSLLYVVD